MFLLFLEVYSNISWNIWIFSIYASKIRKKIILFYFLRSPLSKALLTALRSLLYAHMIATPAGPTREEKAFSTQVQAYPDWQKEGETASGGRRADSTKNKARSVRHHHGCPTRNLERLLTYPEDSPGSVCNGRRGIPG